MTKSERETRRERIDPRLEAAGWRVLDPGIAKAESILWPVALSDLPTDNGPAEYALCAARRIESVVEAKKLPVGPDGALTQAERYSRGIDHIPGTRASSACRFSTPPTVSVFCSTTFDHRGIAVGRSLGSTHRLPSSTGSVLPRTVLPEAPRPFSSRPSAAPTYQTAPPT